MYHSSKVTGQTTAPKFREPTRQTQRIIIYWSRNALGNLYQGRKTWTVITRELLEAQYGQVWEVKIPGGPFIQLPPTFPHTILLVLPLGAQGNSHSQEYRKIPSCCLQCVWRSNHFKICQSSLFFLRETILLVSTY